jgi:hypothetical protein
MQDHAGGRHRQGTIYHVRVDLTAPGGEVVVNREPGEDHTHEDLHVAIRDAFDAARRRLQDRMRRLDRQTKLSEPQPIGRIARVFAERDYAFLETDEGEYRLELCQRASATDLLRRVLAVLRLTVGNCRRLSKISGAGCLSDVSLICRDQKTK